MSTTAFAQVDATKQVEFISMKDNQALYVHNRA